VRSTNSSEERGFFLDVLEEPEGLTAEVVVVAEDFL
jgi:hypothetical protein